MNILDSVSTPIIKGPEMYASCTGSGSVFAPMSGVVVLTATVTNGDVIVVNSPFISGPGYPASILSTPPGAVVSAVVGYGRITLTFTTAVTGEYRILV